MRRVRQARRSRPGPTSFSRTAARRAGGVFRRRVSAEGYAPRKGEGRLAGSAFAARNRRRRWERRGGVFGFHRGPCAVLDVLNQGRYPVSGTENREFSAPRPPFPQIPPQATGAAPAANGRAEHKLRERHAPVASALDRGGRRRRFVRRQRCLPHAPWLLRCNRLSLTVPVQ